VTAAPGRTRICTWIACAAVAWAGLAAAAPGGNARATYQAAVQLVNSGNEDQALALIDEALAAAPRDLPLLGLKGRVLLALRDYRGALAAYEAYLAAGVTGANQRQAQQIVQRLIAVRTTFLDITLANGPATIYVDSRTQGLFCTASPACHEPILPGDYKVIAERPGFEIWTERLTVPAGQPTRVAITLVEKPSRLTVRVAQPGAQITVDGAAYGAPVDVAAGTHRVAVALPHHRAAQLDAVAHEGKPVELDVALTPLVPIRVEPAGAALSLDGKPIAIDDGTIEVPPGPHVLIARAQGLTEHRVDVPAERPADYQIAIRLAASPAAPGGEPASTRVRVATGMIQAGVGIVGAVGLGFAVTGGTETSTAVPVLFAAGGAAILTGTILWLTAPGAQPPHAVAITPMVGNDRVGLTLAGRF
jgi:hypothetical protein